MSVFRIVRPSLTLGLALLLAGCVAVSGLGGTSAQPVLQGALNIAAPSGYCVDPAGLREEDDRAVVLMGRCNDHAKVKPAMLSLSVGPAGSAGVMAAGGSELAGFFTSAEGRATLAPSGRAADVRVIEALSAGDAFLMLLQEKGGPSYWRAVLGLRGRLVMISAHSGRQEPLAATDGRDLIDSALAAMRRANRT